MSKSNTKRNPAPVATPEPAPVAVAPTKRTIEKNRPTQNGITRPSTGGACANVWAECDRLHAAGTYPTVEHMRAYAARTNTNPNNAQIELYVWRKYNGVASVRQPKVAQPTAQ